MNVALWVLSGIVGFVHIGAAAVKLTQSHEEYVAAAYGRWAEDWSATSVNALAVAEILGAIGLFLPELTGIAPILTPLAAFGLAIVQAGALYILVRRGRTQRLSMNVVLLVGALLIGFGRIFWA